MRLPVIGIPCDVKTIGQAVFHGVGEKYINAIAHGSGALPLLLPALGPGEELNSLLDHIEPTALLAEIDGLFLPGSPSNVAPHHYGLDAERTVGPHDPQRDATTLPLIRAALAEGVPLLAICRGLQELNVALGGTLHQEVHEQPDKLDHRADESLPRAEQYGAIHPVRLVAGGVLAELAGCSELMVNSLHGQGVDRLAPGLAVEATAPDGLIEAVRVKGARAFALAVQWHAEWRFWEQPLAQALFAAFGAAARARAERR